MLEPYLNTVAYAINQSNTQKNGYEFVVSILTIYFYRITTLILVYIMRIT